MEENEAASRADTQEDGKAARMQANADLLAHLGTLINRSSLSDLEFICKGAVRVKACRMFLEGRSPVFDSMLTNGMLESNSSVINLPEVPAPALLAILELLYTGNIVDYWPTDWQMGLEIMSVAHFFLLSTVDKIVEEFMVAQISRASEDLQEAAIMLSVALTFKCLSHDESAPFLKLASLLESDWMVTPYACYLSEEAVAFILRHTKPILKIENRLETSVDLEVYFCFRGVLLWCMYNNRSESVEEVDQVINRAMPVARENLYSKGNKDLSSFDVVWLPEYKGEPAQAEILQCLHSQGTFEAALRLLAHVDWMRMPPSIFVKVVEPMKLLSESRVVEIFRFHYLHRVISTRKLTWDSNKSYSLCSNGFIIKKIENSPGSAICKLVTRAGDDHCVWRFSTESQYQL